MNFKKYTLLSLVFLILIVASCTKIAETDIDGGGIPAIDGVTVFDTTINIIASNEGLMGLADETRQVDADQMSLGAITNDPSFGTVNSKIYFQPAFGFGILKFYPFGKKDSIIALDSVVLSIGYRGAYGDTSFGGDKHGFTVKEINNTTAFRDSNYLGAGIANYNLNGTGFNPTLVSSDLITDPTFNPSIADIRRKKIFNTVNSAKDSAENIIRVKLSTIWGQKFINGTGFDTLGAYLNDSAFVKYFNGLELAPKPGQNSLLYYDLTTTKTQVRFYYRTKNLAGTGKIDSTYTDLAFRADRYPYHAQANVVTRTPTYPTTAPGTPAAFGYLDAAPVSNYMKLKIPGITALSNRLLYLAELKIEEDPIVGDMLRTNMYPPSALFLDWYDPLSMTYKTPKKDFVVTDQQGTQYNLAFFGGFRRVQTDPVFGETSYYTFNITRHIQDILSFGGAYNDFRLYAPRFAKPTVYLEATNTWTIANGASNPSSFLVSGIGLNVNPRAADGRIRVGGTKTGSSTRHMKLRLIYSNI